MSQCRCKDTKDNGFETADGFKYMQLPELSGAGKVVSQNGRRHKLSADAELTGWRVLLAAWDAHYYDKQNIKHNVSETPAKKPRLNPPPAKKHKGKGMFEIDERVEVESSNDDEPIRIVRCTDTRLCIYSGSHRRPLAFAGSGCISLRPAFSVPIAGAVSIAVIFPSSSVP